MCFIVAEISTGYTDLPLQNPGNQELRNGDAVRLGKT